MRISKSLFVISLLCLLALFILSTFSALGASAADCNLEISAPLPGDNVYSDKLVTGSAKIPTGGYLWLLSHKRGWKGWWPQGGGEADVSSGTWEVLVKFGKEREIGAFEIAAVIVNQQTNEDLRKWIEEAPAKNYPPINFPNSISGCPIRKVQVTKVGD